MRSKFVSTPRFEVLTAELLRIQVSCGVLRLLVSGYRSIIGSQCLHLQGHAASLHAFAHTHTHNSSSPNLEIVFMILMPHMGGVHAGFW
jgi:hypothetical protein